MVVNAGATGMPTHTDNMYMVSRLGQSMQQVNAGCEHTRGQI